MLGPCDGDGDWVSLAIRQPRNACEFFVALHDAAHHWGHFSAILHQAHAGSDRRDQVTRHEAVVRHRRVVVAAREKMLRLPRLRTDD